MKQYLKVLGVIVLLCVSAGAVIYSLASNGLIGAQPEPPPPPPAAPDLPDPSVRGLNPDFFFARAKTPWPAQLEQETLAEFDKRNSPEKPWYADARTAVRLYAYETATNDPHGEGILTEAELLAARAYKVGCRDPLILSICDVSSRVLLHSLKNGPINRLVDDLSVLRESGYPAVFKYRAAISIARDRSTFEACPKDWLEDMTPSLEKTAGIWQLAGEFLLASVEAGLPPDRIPGEAERLTWATDDNASSMEKVREILDEFLAKSQPPANVRALVLGNFYVDWAWTARGSGWAKDVTPEGWRLMGERLEIAHRLLEAAHREFPNDARIPASLIQVELGQGTGKYRMNLLYEDAIRADPSNFSARCHKIYYLQPRWYGSPREVLEFGLECAATGDWENHLPLLLPYGLDLVAELQPEVYKNKEVWSGVCQIYREYLRRYPNSVSTRTRLFAWAVNCEDWDMASVQRDILKGNWDRRIFGNSAFSKLLEKIPPGS